MKILLKFAIPVLVMTLCAEPAQARKFAAGAGSNNSRTGGAIGLVVNARSSSAAVSSARKKNPGRAPFTWRWWTHRRYCAIARGYTYDYYGTRSWTFGYAYGWRSRSSAIIVARNYTYPYSRAWVSGFNKR